MDILLILFVLILFGVALFLTLGVRRDFIAKERLQRERQYLARQPSHTANPSPSETSRSV
jgi:hypothetical protein